MRKYFAKLTIPGTSTFLSFFLSFFLSLAAQCLIPHNAPNHPGTHWIWSPTIAQWCAWDTRKPPGLPHPQRSSWCRSPISFNPSYQPFVPSNPNFKPNKLGCLQYKLFQMNWEKGSNCNWSVLGIFIALHTRVHQFLGLAIQGVVVQQSLGGPKFDSLGLHLVCDQALTETAESPTLLSFNKISERNCEKDIANYKIDESILVELHRLHHCRDYSALGWTPIALLMTWGCGFPRIAGIWKLRPPISCRFIHVYTKSKHGAEVQLDSVFFNLGVYQNFGACWTDTKWQTPSAPSQFLRWATGQRRRRSLGCPRSSWSLLFSFFPLETSDQFEQILRWSKAKTNKNL